MKVLVACEFSGIVREAFTKRGHDAWSCDLLPTEILGNHYQADFYDVINWKWDLLIAHPPCTYLCNSGVRWLKDNYDRQRLMRMASRDFKILLNCDIEKICIENPIPHKYGELPKYTQIIQPWQFGHGETKATCLWLKGLPKLQSTNIVNGRESRIHKMPPGKDRSKERSRTFKGIAEAMAEQWGQKPLNQERIR